MDAFPPFSFLDRNPVPLAPFHQLQQVGNFMMCASWLCLLSYPFFALPLVCSISKGYTGSHALLSSDWIVEEVVGRNKPGYLSFLPCQQLHESNSWQAGQTIVPASPSAGNTAFAFYPISCGRGWLPAVVNLWIAPVSLV